MGETRGEIADTIHRYPGIHFREITRETDLSSALVQYHLEELRKSEGIVLRRVDRFARYFPRKVLEDLDERGFRILHHVRRAACLDVLLLLLEDGPSRHRDLLADLDIKRSGLSYRLNELRADRIVTRPETGLRYRLSNPDRVRSILDRYDVPSSTRERLAPNPRGILDRLHQTA